MGTAFQLNCSRVPILGLTHQSIHAEAIRSFASKFRN